MGRMEFVSTNHLKGDLAMTGTYKTKDIANKTGIPGNIVRKYSNLLEQNGYIIEKTGNSRTFTMADIRLLKDIHKRVSELDENAAEAVAAILQGKPEDTIPVALQTVEPEQAMSPAKTPVAIYDDMNMTIREQNKKFEEFMNKLDTLAQLNEAIIHQNSTLISQNRQKDEKLDELMQEVYVKESKQENMLCDLIDHVRQTESKQDEKIDNVLSQMYKKESKQDEKMNKLINHVYKQESSRDEQLMSLIREMQETKRMIAASKENTWVKTIKNIFRAKPERA